MINLKGLQSGADLWNIDPFLTTSLCGKMVASPSPQDRHLIWFRANAFPPPGAWLILAS